MADMAVEIRRGDRVESVARADVAVVDSAGRIVAWAGDPDRPTYWRSAAKPFQAIPVVTSGAAARLALAPEDLAIMAASHGGEPRHVERVAGLLARMGASPEDLVCGVHPPSTASAWEALLRQGQAPSALHNNCSGKHTGMLATATALGVPRTGYQEPDHPVQQAIREVVGLFSGMDPHRLETAVDGCGVPTFYLPLIRMAWAYARLVDPRGVRDPEAGAALLVVEAMRHHPEWVSGEGRLEVLLGQATDYRLLAKGGAEGVYCVGVPDRGLGIAVKMDDGTSRAIGPVVVTTLAALGALNPREQARLQAVQRPAIFNHAGRPVGEMVPVVRLHVSPAARAAVGQQQGA